MDKEFDVKMTSPEGDNDNFVVIEPLELFEQIRNMRIGAEVTIKRIK